MAENKRQNEPTIDCGAYHPVLVENILPNMIIASLTSGPKLFRGALMDIDKENLSYGINVSRNTLIENYQKSTSPALAASSTRSDLTSSTPKEQQISHLCNRFSYSLDRQAVPVKQSEITAAEVTAKQQPHVSNARPLINKSINRMRLRARQVVCSICKNGIHDAKKNLANQNNKSVKELRTRPDINQPENRSITRILQQDITNSDTVLSNEMRSNKRRFGADLKQKSETEPKQFKINEYKDKHKVVLSSQNNTCSKPQVVRSSPAIKISFASPKGIGTTVLIPPRPSTPSVDNNDDTDLITETNVFERSSKKLKSKKSSKDGDRSSSKRSKHSKHKSKKCKWSIVQPQSPPPPTPVSVSPGAKSLVAYRFVPRNSPHTKSVSPEAMKCKVVLEKLDENTIAANLGSKTASPDAKLDPKESNSLSMNDDTMKSIDGPPKLEPVGKIPKIDNVSKSNDSDAVLGKSPRSPETTVHNKTEQPIDYQQYFEDISDGESDNPPALESEKAPGSPIATHHPVSSSSLPAASNDANSLKLLIQTRQITRCKLEDGRVLAVGDVVWGKIVGFPWWPGRVTLIIESHKDFETIINRSAHVNWFGSSTMSVMDCNDLFPYTEFYKEKFTKKRKGTYKTAIKEANLVAQSLQTCFKVDNVSFAGCSNNQGETDSCELVRFSDISSCESSQDSAAPDESVPGDPLSQLASTPSEASPQEGSVSEGTQLVKSLSRQSVPLQPHFATLSTRQETETLKHDCDKMTVGLQGGKAAMETDTHAGGEYGFSTVNHADLDLSAKWSDLTDSRSFNIGSTGNLNSQTSRPFSDIKTFMGASKLSTEMRTSSVADTAVNSSLGFVGQPTSFPSVSGIGLTLGVGTGADEFTTVDRTALDSEAEDFGTVSQTDLDFVTSPTASNNFLDDMIDQGLISGVPPDPDEGSCSLGPFNTDLHSQSAPYSSMANTPPALTPFFDVAPAAPASRSNTLTANDENRFSATAHPPSNSYNSYEPQRPLLSPPVLCSIKDNFQVRNSFQSSMSTSNCFLPEKFLAKSSLSNVDDVLDSDDN